MYFFPCQGQLNGRKGLVPSNFLEEIEDEVVDSGRLSHASYLKVNNNASSNVVKKTVSAETMTDESDLSIHVPSMMRYHSEVVTGSESNSTISNSSGYHRSGSRSDLVSYKET